jgi:phosphohistidine phosphatase
MTRFLIVFRHGKSDWEAQGGSDHARGLARRGVRAARRMGRYLRETGQVPDFVLTSSAVRARTTAELATAAGDWGAPIEVRDDLYLASVDTVVAAIEGVADEVTGLVVTGHQPTSSALVAHLTGADEPEFPTAAMARIDFDGPSWNPLGAGRLAWLVVPRELDDRS